MPGWPICACSDGKFPSHLGEIPGKSSEIPPMLTPHMNTLCFYNSFLKEGEIPPRRAAEHLTGHDHHHMNSFREVFVMLVVIAVVCVDVFFTLCYSSHAYYLLFSLYFMLTINNLYKMQSQLTST